ncbi:hypothetical protein ANTRET_LOCUS6572 [Anthophora retusa]
MVPCVFCLCVARSLPRECVYAVKRLLDPFFPGFEWIHNWRRVNETWIVFKVYTSLSARIAVEDEKEAR